MKRFSLTILVALTLSVIAIIPGISEVQAANSPPLTDSTGNLKQAVGPDGVTMMPANPAVQPDGILVPDVFGSTPNWNLTPPIRKFVDSLAPLGCSSANNLGQCIPIAVPDKRTFPGSDYYEIELRQYTEKVHTDIPNQTTFRGYKQVNNGTNSAGTANNVAPPAIHYLGPLIITQKGRPVRIKFVNKLPLEAAESFFIPVDRTVMGSGLGPKNADGSSCDPVWDPRGRNGLPTTEPTCATYTTNRAELHLHGGLSPWISDGTPHQWITPAGEATPYKKADNVQYVPDMWFSGGNVVTSCAGDLTCGVGGASNNPGDGAQTYYYTNEQSARLMFYHDHSYGITRLNVYAGEAAGYMIQDPTEIDLITRGVIPSDQIPLVIQDKAFVDPATIGTLDPTWSWGTGTALPLKWIDSNGNVIGSCAGQATCSTPGARKIAGRTPKAGDLWWPHVYLPAENPSNLGGVNPMGRWVYGLYFWPPTTGIKFLPVNNPYYDCDPLGICNSPWEPPTMPAPPNPSWTAEAFLDTPMVNGTVYPKLDVQPKPYRLRILNAAHDRFLNLQLYEADTTVNANTVNAACASFAGGCAANTEVKMVPAISYPAFPLWDAAADQRVGGVPDPATSGPAWIQIGNEGGFLPTPTVIPSQPISFVLDPTLFNVGNVNDGSLIMGPAERADVIVDFSQYAGKTLILYNDAPAAFPAFVPNNDYYTDAPDTSGTGGHPGPKAGIGPNTRTIMQINVASATPSAAFDLNRLINEFTTTPTQDSVFKKSQHPTIVGQSSYDAAYNLVFPSVAPFWGIANIGDQNISFASLNPVSFAPEIVYSYPMQPKALHDEMGAVWDEYGRMSAKLGVELPNTNNINQIFVMQNYVDPPTENVQDGKVQLWKLTHNGVDTHPLHFHLFDVQVVNRVGWDGFVRLPWANELGWKDTVRISPLEDTIVAMRPKAPPVPFPLGDSKRLKNPTYPNDVNVTDGFMNLDPLTGQAKVPADNNAGLFNYGAEYVWHCHILSHEEQDMMRPLVLRVATGAPADPSALSVTAGFQKNTLSWIDNSYSGTVLNPYDFTLGFYIERCNGVCNAGSGVFSRIAEMSMISSANPSYVDQSVSSGATYTYRVIGYNRYTTNGAANGSWINGLTAPTYSAAVVSSTWTPASTLSLVPDFASPHSGPIKFIALAGGTTVQPQYRFWVNGSLVQDYSVTRYWVMPAIPSTGTAATYSVKVDTRTNYASSTPDVSTTVSFTLLPTVDTTPPVTTAIPSAGAFLNPVQVYLQVDDPTSVTRYTVDGTTPTATNGIIYTTPISISATTTLKYYSTDPAGNAEIVQSGLYELRPINLNASVAINGGAAVTNNTSVILSISATGATKMRFSNDSITYSADETYGSSKVWTLAPATPDGQRFVYVRFTDTSGVLQSPVTASITLDTTAPITTASPGAATFITTVNVALTSNEIGGSIKYTIDGSNPITSITSRTYSGPITIAATTQLNYYSTDQAGNMEAIKSGIYNIHSGDLTVHAFTINGGSALTNNPNVTLAINATDATSVVKMRFSNDGVTYSADEPYGTAKNWILSAGDGVKTVFVRFTDGAGILYDPVTTQITLHTTAPIVTATPPSGTYVNSVNIFLTADEPGSIIKYTFDGTDPRTSATTATYTGAFNLNSTTTVRYCAIDPAGNTSVPVTAPYTITTANIAASMVINNGVLLTNNPLVTLTVTATNVNNMSFSNNGTNYSAAEPYGTTKSWMLDPVDGIKAVFVRFTDPAGTVYAPVTAQITLDTVVPVTTANPPTGTFVNSINVYLTSSEALSVIKYTVDGSDPTTSATAAIYTGPITINSTTSLRYFSTDPAGNTELPNSVTYTITSSVISATLSINGGAALTNNPSVNLSLSATGVDRMSFSNDGITYTTQEVYAISKIWTLSSGDGVKTIFVRFSDSVHNISYDPVTAQITLHTVKPVTTAVPATGTFITSVNVTLSASEPGSTIRYTVDGSDPSVSATAVVYTVPVTVSATTTLRYFATDPAGNIETPVSDTYTITSSVISATVAINGGAAFTGSQNVNLTIAAVGVDKMSFSNNGITYSAQEPYAISKVWILNPGDAFKTVYVKFFSTAQNLAYDPVTAQITLDTAKPVTTALPAPATFISGVSVTLATNEPGSIIKYTLDGSDPTTSATAITYNGSFYIAATTPVRYFATDPAGNAEVPKSGLYTITSSVIAATVTINGGAIYANSPNVNLGIAATGVNKMSFSNNGTTFSVPETYASSRIWALSPGDGSKTVYVKFFDTTNNISYDPVIAQIVLDTTAPATAISPASGIFINPINVALTASEPGSTILFTLDGSDPTASGTAATYTSPINISATTMVTYFARDAAGNAEAVKSSNYIIHSADLTVNTFNINGGAPTATTKNVTLAIDATDAMTVTKMRFSNDGVNYTADEPYAISKSWMLSTGDGVKTVFVRFTDGANMLYDPVTAQIVLDTVAPATSITPAPAIFISPVTIALTANETGSTIKYTLDGSDPATSATSTIYSAPINISATTAIKYFARDAAGNAEAVKSGTYTIHDADLTVNTFTINSGSATTTSPNVVITIDAIDAMTVVKMRFSNDGVNFSADETYATSKNWVLSNGDGVKTVFVRFTDGAGQLYNPVTTQIILDTVAPATSITPAPGVYISTVNAILTANESGSTIRYTLDGTDPTLSSPVYSAPIAIGTTAAVKYFATDAAGNAEAVKSSLYTIHTADLKVNMFTINGGTTATNNSSVNLNIDATDEYGVSKMRFSNDGASYTADEPYAIGKSWTISNGDGIKTVYVQFTDGTGKLYDPVTTQIRLDTVPSATTSNPPAGTVSLNPFSVTLSATDGTGSGASSIKYTTDGSDPLTSSTVVTYISPISITADSKLTIRYFSTDVAGNKEAVQSAAYEATHAADDMVASVVINSGGSVTTTQSVTLNLSANDISTGVANEMQFSNDGITYSPIENYATTKAWDLTAGEGQKTVYVKFKDLAGNSGKIYGPYTSQITLAFKNGLLPGSTGQLESALKALQIAKGNIAATPLDLAHADVAPYVNGKPQPDGKIDLLDVYVLMLHLVGIVGL
jgi:FtsP/CotA-like multicopper oxidase with cupredoxin domain